MKFVITKEVILFSSVSMVIMLMIAGVAYWHVNWTPEVCKLLKENNITAGTVETLVLCQHYTQVGDQIIKGQSYEISHPRVIQKILSGLHNTNARSIERKLVFNSELVIGLKNNKRLRIGIVIDRDNEPQYVGGDYAIPSIEFRQIVHRILTNKEAAANTPMAAP